jgi:hypothetical protein
MHSTFRRLFISVLVLGTLVSARGARVAPREPIPFRGLIGWWRGNGNAIDSARGHNGILRGGMDFTSGISGQAFAAGSGRRVFVPDSRDFEVSSFTIGAWVNVEADGYCVFFRGDNRTGFDPFALSGDLTGRMNLSITAVSGESETISAPITYHVWHQVTGTFDAGSHNLRLYIDGKLVAKKITSIEPLRRLDDSQVPGLGIGNVQDYYDFPFQGAIDEVVLFSRALSSTEVRKLTYNPDTLYRGIRRMGWQATIPAPRF